MTISRRSIGALGVCAVFAMGLATPAFAGDDLLVNYNRDTGTITRTQPVKISDLRLNTAAGRATLDRRITFAAKKVCDYNGGNGLRPSQDYTRCFREARNTALDSARLIQTASR